MLTDRPVRRQRATARWTTRSGPTAIGRRSDERADLPDARPERANRTFDWTDCGTAGPTGPGSPTTTVTMWIPRSLERGPLAGRGNVDDGGHSRRRSRNRWVGLAALSATLLLAGCSNASNNPSSATRAERRAGVTATQINVGALATLVDRDRGGFRADRPGRAGLLRHGQRATGGRRSQARALPRPRRRREPDDRPRLGAHAGPAGPRVRHRRRRHRVLRRPPLPRPVGTRRPSGSPRRTTGRRRPTSSPPTARSWSTAQPSRTSSSWRSRLHATLGRRNRLRRPPVRPTSARARSTRCWPLTACAVSYSDLPSPTAATSAPTSCT